MLPMACGRTSCLDGSRPDLPGRRSWGVLTMWRTASGHPLDREKCLQIGAQRRRLRRHDRALPARARRPPARSHQLPEWGLDCDNGGPVGQFEGTDREQPDRGRAYR